MAQIYYDKDAKLEFIQNKMVVIVGYGSQGHAQAQNLRDSGIRVVVAVREGSKSYKKAVADGFLTASIEKATKEADIIQILIPDHAQGQVYQNEIAPNLTVGKVLGFSHGFNIHFGQITVPDNLDVIMVAPKGPGSLVRKVFEEGKGVPSLIAIHQDYSGNAKDIALAYAKGIGATRAGVIETTFAEETETDLFGEQAVLCGGVSELIKAGFDTLTEAGYQPEIAYFECLHELKLIVDLIYEGGLTHMRNSVSDTAEYGDMIAGERVINEDTRLEMKRLLYEIQTGQFAKEWILENRVGRPVFNSLKRREENHPIEKIGKSLREMMAWIKK